MLLLIVSWGPQTPNFAANSVNMRFSLSGIFSFVFKVTKFKELIYIDGCLELEDNHRDPLKANLTPSKIEKSSNPWLSLK